MTILKDITEKKHRQVEALPLIQTLMQGKVTKELYVHYLFELCEIYKHLENLAKEAGLLIDMPSIERYDALVDDLHELDMSFNRPLMPSTIRYINYLKALSYHSPNLLMAHVYVRHMGDLYGGKLMARVIPGSGRAYQFEDRPGIIKAFNNKLTIDLGEEANKAFDFFIDIFNELYMTQGN
jgi:heme oxygenase